MLAFAAFPKAFRCAVGGSGLGVGRGIGFRFGFGFSAETHDEEWRDWRALSWDLLLRCLSICGRLRGGGEMRWPCMSSKRA